MVVFIVRQIHAGKDVFHAQITIEHEGRRSKLKSQLSDLGDGSYQIFFYYGIQPDKIYIHVTGNDGGFVGGKGPVWCFSEEFSAGGA
jgi:hypothetical protein